MNKRYENIRKMNDILLRLESILTVAEALLEEWKAMGLPPEKQDLYCDIAMELDRNRAAEHGIPCDIIERLGKGDSFCRVRLWKKKRL